MTATPPPASDIKQFDLTRLETEQPEAMLGYSVTSTAPINAEDEPVPPTEPVQPKIRKVASFLVDSHAPEIVISIHGYGTQRADAIQRYEKIYSYAAKVCPAKTHVFFGYLWPSEKPTGDDSIPDNNLQDKIRYALQALPVAPSRIFKGGLAVAVGAIALLLLTNQLNGLLAPLLFLTTISFAILLGLILLRLSAYFRDNYRATNYGVPDLVELLRQVDQAVYTAVFVDSLEGETLTSVLQKAELSLEQWQAFDRETRVQHWENIPDEVWKAERFDDHEDVVTSKLKKIKLSFIGHSMGCFVVTNTLRILSDVFDHRAIEGIPSGEIGRVFCLGRLVLVAPDIPIETIMPRRANFLRSSLLRCEESYVFCNEGDLALRLASTTANYFSFPAKTRSSGYRLGNITAQRFDQTETRNNRRLSDAEYGIINLKNGKVESPFYHLEIRASDQEHQTLNDIRDRRTLKQDCIKDTQTTAPVSDLFTYFDCTDYVDTESDHPPVGLTARKPEDRGIVSNANRKAALNLWDYFLLCLTYFASKPRYINVHGGYFDGIFSQQAMYQIAFSGFNVFLKLFDLEGKYTNTPFDQIPSESRLMFLNNLSQHCQEKGIQVVLAPSRYEKNILGKS